MKEDDEKPKTKRCTGCGRELPLEAFTINLHGIYGRQSRCKECLRKQAAMKRQIEKQVSGDNWRLHNLALEKYPWPFNSDEHAMNMKEVHEAAMELNKQCNTKSK